ncbi:MBL fold metallo-hydrolase [Propylenella binzhouense]|uniref:MBL fold metallo-hydrolase n=1 Tax=Propylenella binzhouense TaxID=2555902 RepID=A0A964T9W6_9HYPH|nr:MBL fold metallo-hydrolase [Propylenella binzhouense]MYZ50007.1 MBL fold metallo-hydrolase [Propylenella binzhouense]
MTPFICETCGTQFAPSAEPPSRCPVCDDERQYVGPGGQRWTTLQSLRAGHANVVRACEPGLFSIRTEPSFAIGQRAFLLVTPAGNLLWDCVALLDEATETFVRGLGGLAAIAISHPHYYTTMAEWAEAFDAPVLLHEADRQWVMRPSARIRFWPGEQLGIADGLTLVRCGGHFAGGTALHWAAGASGAGALLPGDVLQVVQDRRHVSFMRSYPNLIPLSAGSVRRIVEAVSPLPFETVYGAFAGRTIARDGKAAVIRSAERYIRAVSGEGPADAERAGGAP